MRALIIDDERLARNELRRMLGAVGEVDVVGEARNADDALDQIRRLHPELLFLDVQMPGSDGFELLERLDAAPSVIFTTAFDHYALRAFEVNALDYLVKPIAPQRLAAAVAKAAARAPIAAGGEASGPLGRGQRIFVRDGERCWFVAVEDIVLIESEGNYARLYFAGHRPLLPRSLNAIGDRLDPGLFFRANRRQIINLESIESLAPWPNDGYLVKLSGGLEVEMSRRQARLFHARARL
ncbi:MAG TPA: LytTR family DNA-binding domain-containing protein [Kofleriaceae bacterium]|nr:LytTR family DNA-binding domain-containing protein [Kofleriaceae bacterium]